MSKMRRPELSTKNQYHLSKHRYLELYHFCLQYPEWKTRYRQITVPTGSILKTPEGKCTDLIAENAIERAELAAKIDVLEQSCMQAADDLYPYLLKAVTEGYSYEHMSTMYDVPCCRVVWYEMYRKFFYILSQ